MKQKNAEVMGIESAPALDAIALGSVSFGYVLFLFVLWGVFLGIRGMVGDGKGKGKRKWSGGEGESWRYECIKHYIPVHPPLQAS
jgi:hypothetical protein